MYRLDSVGKILSALTLAVALAGLSQAATAAQPVTQQIPPTKQQARPQATPQATPQTVPDGLIEHKIQAKFAKSKINSEHFTVSVKAGVATIEGKTSVIQHKGVATRLAKTGGAVAVKNHIQVSDEARTKAAARLAGRGDGTQLAHATVLPPAPK